MGESGQVAGRTTATHCPYCALQCGMTLTERDGALTIAGNDDFPVNNGALCVKGWHAAALLDHPERLRAPLARDAQGRLAPVGWDEALDRVTRAVTSTQARYGRDAVAVFGGGGLTNEKAYALGKFARVVLGTANIDYNGRFCMSSAAAAALQAFGLDRGLPFPLADIATADVILLAGSNPAATMPPLMHYFAAQRAAGGRLIVADPRRGDTGDVSDLHLHLAPGTDAALANGLLHILIRDGWIDREYIAARTEGFARVRATVAGYWPERVERLTGVPQARLVEAARLLGAARTALILTARGVEQHAQGVANTLAYINLALALGLVGRPGSGWGSLTGQGNGQGGREHGQKADQLPGYRLITDPAARQHIAALWGIAARDLPGPGKSAYELLAGLGSDGGARMLLVFGSNIAVSAPNLHYVRERLRTLDCLVVADCFLSETAVLADVVLPVAQWAEEDGTTTNLEGRVLRRRRAVAPPAGVRTDLQILRALAERLGQGHHFASDDPRAVFAELCQASAGGPADYSGITYDKIAARAGVCWPCPTADHPGTPRLFQETFPTPNGRARFGVARHEPPVEELDAAYPLYLTTGRVLAQYQSGTQTRRVARLRELAPEPLVEIHPATARRYRLAAGDSVRLTTRRGTAVFTVRLTPGIREDTVFVPFHWGGARAINQLTNPALDPVSKMPEFKVCAVRLECVEADTARGEER